MTSLGLKLVQKSETKKLIQGHVLLLVFPISLLVCPTLLVLKSLHKCFHVSLKFIKSFKSLNNTDSTHLSGRGGSLVSEAELLDERPELARGERHAEHGPMRGEHGGQLTNHSSPGHNTHPLDQSEVSIVAS